MMLETLREPLQMLEGVKNYLEENSRDSQNINLKHPVLEHIIKTHFSDELEIPANPDGRDYSKLKEQCLSQVRQETDSLLQDMTNGHIAPHEWQHRAMRIIVKSYLADDLSYKALPHSAH